MTEYEAIHQVPAMTRIYSLKKSIPSIEELQQKNRLLLSLTLTMSFIAFVFMVEFIKLRYG